jgi:lysophospholipase L1-like esterase
MSERFQTPGDTIPRLFNLGFALVCLGTLAALALLTESGDPIWYKYSIRLLMLMGVLLFLAAFTGLLGIKGSSRANQNTLLVLVSCVMGFLFAEIGIRIYEEDPWQKFRVVRKMRDEGKPAYPIINPFGERLHRLSPVPNALTVLGNEGYGWVTYTSDENGFRNPPGLYSRSDRLDVFAVGDSFTIGCDVPNEVFWVNLLREQTGLAVYNAGVPAAAPIQELARLQVFGLPKAPRVVLWVFYDNDYIGLPTEIRSPFLKALAPPELKERFRVEEARIEAFMTGDELKAWIDERLNRPVRQGFYSDEWRTKPIITLLRFHSRLVDKLIELTDRQVLFHEETLQKAERFGPLLKEVLASAERQTRSRGGKVVFVYLPGVGYWLDDTEDTFEQVRRHTLGIARSLNLAVFDFKEAVDRLDVDPFDLFAYGKKGGHYSPDGNRVLAEELARYLKSEVHASK